MDEDAGAFGERWLDGVEHRSGTGDRDADVGSRITQREEDGGGAGPPGDLSDLPLDPDVAESRQPLADLHADHPDRPGGLRRAARRFGHPAEPTGLARVAKRSIRR